MKLTLGKKIGLGFAVILTLMVFSSTMAYLKSADIRKSEDRALDIRYPSVEAAIKLEGDVNQAQSKGRQVILAGAQKTRREAAKQIFDVNWDSVDKDVAALDALAPQWTLQENRDRLADIKKHLSLLRAVQESAMNRAAGSERDAIVNAGNEFADKGTTSAEAIKATVGVMGKSFAALVDENKEEMRADNRSLKLTIAVTTLVALGIGSFVAIFLSRAIAGATRSVLAQAEAIAAGDLTLDDLKVRSHDELGDLTTAINRMSGSLKRTIMAITENAVQVASASEELNSTSQQITANSEETSAQADVVSRATQTVTQNLQTVATGAEEMGASIKEITKNATEAARVATGAVKVAETTNEMSRNVSEAAQSSGEITSNISGVADAAQSTSRGAADTQKAAQQLVETSAELRRLVEQFKTSDGTRGADGARSMAARAGQ